VAAGRNDVDVHAPEAAIPRGVRGIIGQGVLVANVVRNLFTNGVDIFDVFREVGNTAGGLRDGRESAASGLGALFAFLAE